MKKIIGLFLIIFLAFSVKSFADSNRVSLQDGTGNEVGTASNPLKVTFTGINWYSLPQSLQNVAINWTDIREIQKTSAGVNWSDLEPLSGGINWFALANGAAAKNIVCWRTDGQLGKCTTGVSGVACTACN